MGGLREVSVLLLICFQSSPAKKPEPASHGSPNVASGLRVAVRVYDGVNLSSREISRAEQEAEKIFRYAGIQLAWTTGLVSADVNDNTPSERWNPASLQLRIWPSAMAGKRPTSSETLGFCLSLENGDAVVLADAIQKRASFGTTNFADLLGLAMAHELGHLLLRSAAHSVTGIMRARWTEKALGEDDRGYLRFIPGEAESMRSEVSQRGLRAHLLATSYLRAGITDQLTYQQSPGPASWETHLDQALQLQEQGRYGEADVEYRLAVQDTEHLGLDAPAVANILINVGRLRTLQHKYSEARMAFERSLGIVEKTFGSDYFEVGLIVGNIAMIHHQEGHFRIAEPLYRRAIMILERNLPPQDVRTAIFKAGLAKLLVAQRRYTEGEALLEDTIPVLEKREPPDDSNLSITLINLAEAYRADGSYGKAEPLYRRVLAMLGEGRGLRTEEIRLGLVHLTTMLRKMKRKTEARAIEEQLKTMLPK